MIKETREIKRDPASFRDPASQVFTGKGMVFREILPSYYQEYDRLMNSGLYAELVDQGLLIPHRQVHRNENNIIIEADPVPFISYPYEWSFAQLQEAALNTLEINRTARRHGMMLKDASAYNMQVLWDRMRLIDTCSFITCHPGDPWYAYPQFLRHFVSPLVLMKYSHTQEAKMSQQYLDGIPVHIARRRVPIRARFNTGMLIHIISQSYDYAVTPNREVKWNDLASDSLLNNLAKFVRSMVYKPRFTDFTSYSDCCGYSPESLKWKKDVVTQCIRNLKADLVLDLGCNTGTYSMIALEAAKKVIAVDSDHDCIFSLWEKPGLLPLIVDITNPSPGIGWVNQERKSFWDRVGEVDCIMALALVHHLCIRHNIPLGMVADLLADHARNVIIEWVPPEDDNAKKLQGKKVIPEYHHGKFKEEFTRRFRTVRESKIRGSGRIIYQLERK